MGHMRDAWWEGWVHIALLLVQRFLFPFTAYPLPSSDLFVTSIVSVAVYTDVLLQDSLSIPLFSVKLLGA